MCDVNFVIFDGVEDEISKARNDDHARIWLIHLAALMRCVRELHGPIYQTRHNT